MKPTPSYDLSIIAGPCSVESLERIIEIAHAVKKAGATMLRGGAFKPRTSRKSFQGLGREGVNYLVQAGKEAGLPVITEVLDVRDVDYISSRVQILQIGTRNMYNYTLLKEAGKTGLPVLLKRGFAATIEEWISAAEYIESGNVIFCERGIRSFDPATRAVLDLSAVSIVKSRTGAKVVVDPSHGTGRSDLVLPMSKAAIASGCDGLLIEAHTVPACSISDSMQTVDMEDLRKIAEFSKMYRAVF